MRSLGHQDVERDIERDEHREREDQARQQRLPPGDAADETHEACDQQKARDVDAEPLRRGAEQKRRDEDLHHAAELIARDEGLRAFGTLDDRDDQPEQRGTAEDQAKIERQIARLRAVLRPGRAAFDVVVAKDERQRDQQDVGDDLDLARRRDRRRIVLGLGGLGDCFGIRCGHGAARMEALGAPVHARCDSAGPRTPRERRRAYFSTNPASTIRFLFKASSCSRKVTMSLPVRKTGFSACFSM